MTDRAALDTFLRFCVAGAGSFVVNIAVFAICVRLLGLAPAVSAVFAFVAAVGVGYGLNRWWTFPSRRGRRIASQAGRYLVISLASLAVAILALSLLISAGVDPVAAQALSIAALMPIRFAVTRSWSFA